MILYVRCDVTGKGDVDNVFLDLKELAQGTDAESIYNSLREALRDAGFDDEFLFINLISIATDGASVLTGKNSGVIARLKQDFPKIQSIHCLCHRLELAVHDSLKLVAGCNHFEIFVSKLYTLYNQSAKNVRLLEEAAAELNMQLLKIGQIFTIRWVSSSFRTVKAVWNNYPALASHFKVASEDPSRNDTERKKFLGLHKQLSNAGFVADLACMKDMLRELQALSLRLQQRDIDIVSANCQIQQCIDVLSAMKECGGKSAQKAEERITQGLFKGLELVESSGKIKRGQFYQSVIDNLKKRMPESDLNDVVVTVQTQGGGREGEKETQELQNDVVTVQTQGGGRGSEKETQELQNDVVTVQTQGGGRGSEKETQELQMRLQDQYPFPQASSQLKERESQGPRARQPTRRAEVKRQKYQYKKRSRTMKAAQMRRKQLWTVNVRDKVRLRHRMPQILSHL
ncbi:hypothetical protein JOQ06_006139 [Pogonophryne albipinna]|uniref:Zinc finger protein 862-like n=1 Tax=Pogonophryne albipinna TaxID=1090488 RepID=A0AAD6BK52_9TELE|nr:hypothetical protein JOQ06_006139 [Pogonophryne albipinna]